MIATRTKSGGSRRWREAIALVLKSLKNAAAARSAAVERPQIWRWRSERKQTVNVRERQHNKEEGSKQ